ASLQAVLAALHKAGVEITADGVRLKPRERLVKIHISTGGRAAGMAETKGNKHRVRVPKPCRRGPAEEERNHDFRPSGNGLREPRTNSGIPGLRRSYRPAAFASALGGPDAQET